MNIMDTYHQDAMHKNGEVNFARLAALCKHYATLAKRHYETRLNENFDEDTQGRLFHYTEACVEWHKLALRMSAMGKASYLTLERTWLQEAAVWLTKFFWKDNQFSRALWEIFTELECLVFQKHGVNPEEKTNEEGNKLIAYV